MPSEMLVNATDLEGWPGRDAQGTLPQLIRRLVFGTPGIQVSRCEFRAHEGIHLSGYDGIVSSQGVNAFVPEGDSRWELGTNKDIKRKANKEYKNRTENMPENPLGVDIATSTFVFVTPRRWSGKDTWVNERKAEGRWRDVRAYDADDLETRLEQCPAVHVWISIKFGKRPENAEDLESFWNDWASATNPPLSPEVLLAGRESVVERIKEWLNGESRTLSLRAGSKHEAIAVFASVLQSLPEDKRETWLSRSVIAKSSDACKRLADSQSPLLLIHNFDGDDGVAIGRVQRSERHRNVIPLGRDDSLPRRNDDQNTGIDIGPVSREGIRKFLIGARRGDNEAYRLAGVAYRSFVSFRRGIAHASSTQRPAWSKPAEARNILPALLAGRWREGNEGDCETLSYLAGKPYEEVKRVFQRWEKEIDPPVKCVGDVWMIVSKEDAWELLSAYLTQDDFKLFEAAAFKVLKTPGPKDVVFCPPPFSRHLRNGIADTIALMGAWGKDIPSSSHPSAQNWAKRIVSNLFLSPDESVWDSLADVTPTLAEVAPDEFLAALERKTDWRFQFGPALETIAWSEDYFSRAALLLAKFAKLTPKNSYSHDHPAKILERIFLLWYPQTSASLEARLRVVDVIRRREPDVSWELLSYLLPEGGSATFDTARPRWRDWASQPVSVTHAEYEKSVCEIVERVIADVSASGARWKRLIQSLYLLPAEMRQKVIEKLEAVEMEPQERAILWNALRDCVAWFRERGPQEESGRLERLLQKFEPENLVERYAWLFTACPVLLEVNRSKDYSGYCALLSEKRMDALQSVYQQSGLNGLVELARRIELPFEMGTLLGKSELLTDGEENDLLKEFLASEEIRLREFMGYFVQARQQCLGLNWIIAKLADGLSFWTPQQRAHFYICLPFSRGIWEAISRDLEGESLYWQSVDRIAEKPDDVWYALERFIAHGRLDAVIKQPVETLSVERIAELLEMILKMTPVESLFGVFFGDWFNSWFLPRLFGALIPSENVTEDRIASLEWAFLPILENGAWSPRFLHKKLTKDPNFFVKLIALITNAKDNCQNDRAEVGRAKATLDSWFTPPGMENGKIDGEQLKNWVTQVRGALAENDRWRKVGDDYIGKLLGGLPPDDQDEVWPHRVVRDIVRDISSEEVEEAMVSVAYSGRGKYNLSLVPSSEESFNQEARYRNFARIVCSEWPRTAAMLRRIADFHRKGAQNGKLDEELRRNLD